MPPRPPRDEMTIDMPRRRSDGLASGTRRRRQMIDEYISFRDPR